MSRLRLFSLLFAGAYFAHGAPIRLASFVPVRVSMAEMF
jgi:hypothetical protein